MAANPDYGSAIASIESGGASDPYSVMGPATKSGDQAHGKYQIMGANIGPWSKEILGQELTPQQFLASPQAQDAIFQGKFGQYVDKYGPEGAAQAWIGGPGGVGKTDRKDSLGTSIGAYGQKFMAALGSGVGAQNAPAAVSGPPQSQIPAPQAAPAFNQPAQPQAALPAYGWSPGQQADATQAQQAPVAQATQPPLNPNMTANAPSDIGFQYGPGGQQAWQQAGQGALPPNAPPTQFQPPPALAQPIRRTPDLSGLHQLLANAPASVRALLFRGQA